MPYNLICVHPFGNYAKGQLINDAEEVDKLLLDREHHFVRVPAPEPIEEVKDEPKLADSGGVMKAFAPSVKI